METTKLYYCVYKITNLITDEISLGLTTINSIKIEDGFEKYRSQLKASINKFSNTDFIKEILSSWETKEEGQKEASRIRTKVYNTLKNPKLSNNEKSQILTNNLFNKKPKLTKDDKKEYQKRYAKENKDKLEEYRKIYNLQNKGKIQKWKNANKDIQNEKAREYYHTVSKFKERNKAYNTIWKSENADKIKKYHKDYYNKYKKEIANEKILEGNSGDDWVFYTLKFKHKILDFSFFKYGITSKSIHSRFSNGNYTDFEYKIIDTQMGSKDFIKSLEFIHLEESKKDKFIFPIDIEFGGKTECREKLVSRINIV